jgi:hypothetical protein
MEVDLSSGRRREDRCIGKIGGLGLLARGVNSSILKKRKVFFKKIKNDQSSNSARVISNLTVNARATFVATSYVWNA